MSSIYQQRLNAVNLQFSIFKSHLNDEIEEVSDILNLSDDVLVIDFNRIEKDGEKWGDTFMVEFSPNSAEPCVIKTTEEYVEIA